jgi:hypothetical protein
MNRIVGVGHLKAGASSVAPRKRKRRLTLRSAAKQAQAIGLLLKGAVIAADGSIELQFGEQNSPAVTPLEQWRASHHREG